jgi:hypothetical protein
MATAYCTQDLRGKIRQRFNITPGQGDCVECMKGCFCASCSLCQTYRELSYRGYWPNGLCVSKPPVNPRGPTPMGIQMGQMGNHA